MALAPARPVWQAERTIGEELMRLSVIATALLALAPLDAPAQERAPMTGAEFETYTEGRTLTFGIAGAVYGIEQYLPGRRVRWAFVGDTCRDGRWFTSGRDICFAYDDAPGDTHCWQFFDTGSGLVAQSSSGSALGLIEVEQSDEPLLCPGPEVGV